MPPSGAPAYVPIPPELLPEGDSQYDASVGFARAVAAGVGVAVVHRAGDTIQADLPGNGTAHLVRGASPANDFTLNVQVPGKEDLLLDGVLAEIDRGVELRCTNRRTVKVTREGNGLAIVVHGFGFVKDAAHVYLQPRP